MPPHIRVFSADVLLRLIAAKPPGFIQNAVKHLFIEEATTSEAEAIFTACNHVTNLFDNGTYAHDVRALLTLQYIQRLALVISTFLERYTIDNTPSVFRNITHLELLGSCWDHTDLNDVCVRLGLIPSLTHVAFNFAPLHEIFYTTLRADMRLLCIVFLSLDTDEVNNTNPLAGDFRFVCIDQRTAYRVDWLRGADTNDDYWALADSFIAARRMAKVERKLKHSPSSFAALNLTVLSGTLYRIADTDQRWKN
jgi:hypothetical protein